MSLACKVRKVKSSVENGAAIVEDINCGMLSLDVWLKESAWSEFKLVETDDVKREEVEVEEVEREEVEVEEVESEWVKVEDGLEEVGTERELEILEGLVWAAEWGEGLDCEEIEGAAWFEMNALAASSKRSKAAAAKGL